MEKTANAPSAKESSRPGTIYLLRHGAIQSQGKGRRYIGWQDHVLSDMGRRQAYAWADYFNGMALDGVYCSDLNRCLETACIIAARCSLAPQALPELREVCLGAWEGRRFDAVRAADPQEFHWRGEHIADHRPPGGESFDDLQRRVWPVFTKLAPGSHQAILMVTHAGVVRVLLCRLLGMPLKNLFRIGLAYGALGIIDSGQQGFRARAVNLPPPEFSPSLQKSLGLQSQGDQG
jgi:probable phosphoglycerate mutase